MFDFVKNLFRDDSNQSQINYKDKFCGMKVTHLLLLAEFIQAKNREKITNDWDNFLNEPHGKVLDKFISDGLLVQISLASKINLTYKVDDLKLLLKERKLPVSGKKEVLIERLIEEDCSGMQSLVKEIYECSTSARDIVEKYKADKEIEKEKVVNDVMNFILSKNIKKACHIATDYQKQKTTYTPKRQLALTIQPSVETNFEFIETIVNASPEILRGMSKKDLKNLRLWTALFFLFGPNKTGENLIEDFIGIPRFKTEIAKNMMLFFAYRQTALIKLRKLGIKKASVIGSCRCSECAEISNKIMLLDDIPELPYAGCTFCNGCGCCLKPYIAFD